MQTMLHQAVLRSHRQGLSPPGACSKSLPAATWSNAAIRHSAQQPAAGTNVCGRKNSLLRTHGTTCWGRPAWRQLSTWPMPPCVKAAQHLHSVPGACLDWNWSPLTCPDSRWRAARWRNGLYPEAQEW